MSLGTDLFVRLHRRLFAAIAALALAVPVHAGNNPLAHHDHVELDAALVAPYQSERAADARTFTLKFAYPTDAASQVAQWRVQLRTPEGALVEEWRGRTALESGKADVNIDWAGRVGANARLADGIYRVQMTAFSVSTTKQKELSPEVISLDDIARSIDADVIDQVWDIRVGNTPMAAMPAFSPLPVNPARSGLAPDERVSAFSAPATASLPYTVYFGNLHSQTNHSDGGGNVATCTSSQAAQTGQYSPTDAFPYAKAAGLDFLATTEHNHYFDGSSGTNASASPTTVHNLYQSGLTTANNFNTANPGFLAIYGMEWGVISNGGHMNIFNSSELLGWETNSSGQLLADTLTPKSDYPTLYALMKQRGWIGQFNHPDTSGQFLVGGTSLGYSADADEVMVLTEVLNTSAFSNNTTETETGRSSFEGAFNLMLERGFHVAPASNQDNHCANWGKSYTNRTAVLLPSGSTLNSANFITALKARRTFATMDKNSQLILTANGRVMGERFQNSGTLAITANFANTAGRSVSTVNIYEGVPGRNGTVTSLASTASTTITPALGHHFYYAKVTQDDGKILWSAPIWVEQVAAGDTTAPTVSAASSGSSGTITFTATASDNVGVTRVEFFVDGVLKGTDTTAPYSFAFNSTTIANGTHSLTAKAYDAANNVGTSTAVSFTVNNVTSTQLIVNSGFESGAANWTASSGVIDNSTTLAARTGSWKAWMNGYGATHTDTLYQQIVIPSTATTVTLSLWLRVVSDETTTTQAYDTLKVQLRSTTGAVLTTLATYSNLNKGSSYLQKTFNISTYKGQTVRVYFEGIEGSTIATSFLIDDVTVTSQ